VDIKPVAHSFTPSSLVLTWPDTSDVSTYEAGWLYRHRPGVRRFDASCVTQQTWSAQTLNEIPRFSAQQCHHNFAELSRMQCSAKPDGDDWIINGTKHFISHADIADFVIVFVATGEEQTSKGLKKKISCFLVDRGTLGFEIKPGYASVSHRRGKARSGMARALVVFR